MTRVDVPTDCIAFFCSNTCPGDIILKAQDWANGRSSQSNAVMGGFHTPVEKEVLRLLIRNSAPTIYVLGRSLKGWRKPRAIATAIESGFLTAISPFDDNQPRTTARTAEERNSFIVSRVDEVLIAHASPSSKTEALAQAVIDQGGKLLTFASPSNDRLLEMGAIEV